MVEDTLNEITVAEIQERGIELPKDRFEFPISDFESHKSKLKNIGGIYAFKHDELGWLYVGISLNIMTRVRAHITGQDGCSKKLHEKLKELEDVKLTVYREADLAMREFYENYLIIKHNPIYNKAKKSRILEGYDVQKYPKETREAVARLYSLGEPELEIERITGVKVSSQYGVLVSEKIKPKRYHRGEDLVELKEKIMTLHMDGVQPIEISWEVGVSDSRVRQLIRDCCKRDGIKTILETRKARTKMIADIYFSSEKSRSTLAEELGLSESIVRSAIETTARKENRKRPRKKKLEVEQ